MPKQLSELVPVTNAGKTTLTDEQVGFIESARSRALQLLDDSGTAFNRVAVTDALEAGIIRAMLDLRPQ